jgi:Holliday junction resolvase RusA-like endonuclease
MKEYSFIIDGQPMSKKRNYKIIRIGGHYSLGLTKNYRDWAKGVEDQLWVQRMKYMASMTGPWQPISEAVEVTFEFFMKDKKRYDLSNLYQGIEDALVKARILDDDSLIESHDRSRKYLGCIAPRILIAIRPFKC